AQFLSLHDRQWKGWAHKNPSGRNSRLCLRRQALKRSDLQDYFHQSLRHNHQLRKEPEYHAWQRCPDLHVTDRLRGEHAMNRLLDSLRRLEPASLTSDPAPLNRERLRARRRGICGRASPPQPKSSASWRRLRSVRRLSEARELLSSSHRLDAEPTSL